MANAAVWVGVGKYLWIQRRRRDARLAKCVHDPQSVGGLGGFAGATDDTSDNGLSVWWVRRGQLFL